MWIRVQVQRANVRGSETLLLLGVKDKVHQVASVIWHQEGS